MAGNVVVALLRTALLLKKNCLEYEASLCCDSKVMTYTLELFGAERFIRKTARHLVCEVYGFYMKTAIYLYLLSEMQ